MTALPYIISYLVAACAALVLTPLTSKLAIAIGVVDRPGARKVHRSVTPRAGGLAIGLAVICAAVPVFIWAWHHADFSPRVLALLGSAAALLSVGLLDDIFDLPSKYKLVVLVGVAAFFCAAGGRVEYVELGRNTVVTLGWASWPLTILWIVGVTVSMNFIDGLDGLASGIAAVACGVIATVGIKAGLQPVGIVSLSLLGALTGFLVFNFNPAKVFMGDCGSMFIGFVVAACSIISSRSVGTTMGLLLPALALSVPIIDAVLTFVRRGILQRRSLFSAERGHIHHRLIDMGLNQRHAVLLLYGTTLAAVAAGCVAVFGHGLVAVTGGLTGGLLLFGLFRQTGSARDTIDAIKRNRALRREAQRCRKAFEEMQIRFRSADSFDAWWRHVAAASEMMDFVRARLPLTDRDGATRVLAWDRAPSDTQFEECERVCVTLPVRQRRAGSGPLMLELEAPATTFLESVGTRVALFSRLMGEHSLADLPPELPRPASQASAPGDAAAPVGDFVGDLVQGLDLPRALPAGVRVAVVHDFLYTYAGAERVLEQILRVVPDAEVFSLFDFVPPGQRGFILNKTVHTSFIQRMPLARSHHRLYLPLMPLAIEQLDVSNFDVVISSSYVAAKGVLTRSDQLHICYCHSPVRFAWDLQHQYLGETGLSRGPRSLMARMILHYIRTWDARTANGVDVFVRNSDFVGRRIAKVYRRRSVTVYPPVDVEQFTPWREKSDFYLTASRLVPYKRVDLIVQAFTKTPKRALIVIGEGPDFEKIKAKAGPNVRMLGYQAAERLRWYMQRARAFIFAAEEDFGIVPVEAQACGTPVIAYNRGGVTESVIPGVTGLFFNEQTVEGVMEALDRFERVETWDVDAIRANAERFHAGRFREAFSELLRREWGAFTNDKDQSGITRERGDGRRFVEAGGLGYDSLPDDAKQEPQVVET